MDKLNQEILTQLLKNPEKPFLTISEELGISPMTVIDRYEKMKKEGIIMGISIIVDLSKMGYQGKAFLHITTADNKNSETIIKALQQIHNLFLVSEIIGAFDILAMVAFRNAKEIKKIVNRIRAEPGVEKVETSLTNDTTYPVTKEYSQISIL